MIKEKSEKNILWLNETSIKDIPLVGGKNASLAEMFNQLSDVGVMVPDGFAFTTKAYWHFLKENKLEKKLEEIFRKFDRKSIKSLQVTGKKARNLVLRGKFPADLRKEIESAYQKLEKKYGKNCEVAVRSSGVAEDAPRDSFAGQFETFLNIKGKEKLLEAVRKCLASSFNDRVIAYREEKKISHLEFALSIGVQKMVRSDLASSGVIFTLDTETGFPDVVLINSIWGVGEMIVQGRVTPDEFYVHKPTFKRSFKSIILKNLGRKTKKYVFKRSGGLKEVAVAKKDQLKFSLTDEEILTLAKWAMTIEEHYAKAQDIEWAKDGKTGQLFIVQSRPETVHAPIQASVLEEYRTKITKKPILTGAAIGNKIGQGKVRVIADVSKISEFKKGEVLVTKMTDPDWVPIMRIASAIVADEGGRTCFSGDTEVLTNRGHLPIKTITETFKQDDIKVLSLNRQTLQLEWKKVIRGFRRRSNLMTINISQTGRMKNNILKVTPDHKFPTFYNRELISEEIQNIIKNQEGILSPFKIPPSNRLNLSCEIAYLLGAIRTDGHISLNKRHGCVSFIQKPTKTKKLFIEKIKDCFFNEYKYNLHSCKKPASGGIIRGKEMMGSESILLRCFKKEITKDVLQKLQNISNILINANEEFVFNFLAGVIDGDGTYNQKANRINIFCSKNNLLKAIIISCLRLGINFQVVENRTIYNVQLVDRIKEILTYTTRVKGEYGRIKFGTRFFSAKQLLEDIVEKVNFKGRILAYVKNNLLIDAEKIRNYIIPQIKGEPANHSLTKILNSPLKMLRVGRGESLGKGGVYNIEVEDNHNYVVFTSRSTPILVENCHAAIIGRELGIPAIVGTGRATKILKTGQEITVDCTSGQGMIFNGKISFEVKRYNLKKIPDLKTKIMINIGAPDIAFKTSFLPNTGVGLARIEFILVEKIRVHPLALYHYQRLKREAKRDKKIREIIKKIDEITIEHRDKKEYFIKELAEGIAQIAAAFWSKPVIVRFSDLKTNEYRALVGGELFEPEEANPMMGWRGASRYYDPKFQPAFEMECRAIKRAREVFGLKNIKVMIPFCRTVEEGKKVLDLMAKNGLEKGKNGLKVIVMCEIPSNVILADKFLEMFDGYSIGSNDLTQFLLGLDRDSALVAKVGDERNEAVKKMISEVIHVCRRKKKYSGICGDIPSTDVAFAQFLVREGIESISLSPDAVIKTTIEVAKKEKILKGRKK